MNFPMMFLLLFLAGLSPKSDQPKPAQVQIEGGGVWGEGVWRPDNPNKDNKPMEAVTHYQCDITGGKHLVGTEAWCLEISANSFDGMLGVGVEWLKVVRWDDKQIIAVNDSPICLSSQVIFDVERKTAIALDIRKQGVKGALGVCEKVPDRQTYYLQDKADYYIRKSLGKLQ